MELLFGIWSHLTGGALGYLIMCVLKGRKANKTALQSISDDKSNFLQFMALLTVVFLIMEYFQLI